MKLAEMFKKKAQSQPHQAPRPVRSLGMRKKSDGDSDVGDAMLLDASMGSDVGMFDMSPVEFVEYQPQPEDEGLSHAHERYLSQEDEPSQSSLAPPAPRVATVGKHSYTMEVPEKDDDFVWVENRDEAKGSWRPIGGEIREEDVGGTTFRQIGEDGHFSASHHGVNMPDIALMSDDTLRHQLEGYNVSFEGDRHELAQRLYEARLGQLDPRFSDSGGSNEDQEQYIDLLSAEEMGLDYPPQFDDATPQGLPWYKDPYKMMAGIGAVGTLGTGLGVGLGELLKPKRRKKKDADE